MNLAHIAEGWYLFIKADVPTRTLMKRRLAICDQCPHKVQTTGAGQVLATLMGNQAENSFSCGLCHCPLGSLSSVRHPSCRAGKWNNL